MRCLSLYKLFVFVIVLFGIEKLFAQKKDIIRVAFWNFENFFDPFVDTTRHYNEFTEEGSQHWTLSRFYKKRNNMYKAILSLSEGKPLAILGICEVENTFVTSMLFNETPLKKHNYRVVHYEGEDRRGIDVALVANNSNKLMSIIMPIIMGIFTLFYNAAFGLYIVAGALITLITSPLVTLFVDMLEYDAIKKESQKNVAIYDRKRK